MKTYITFGQIHVHSINGKTLDKDCVAVIETGTLEDGQTVVREIFGEKYHHAYPETAWHYDEQMPFFPRGLINVN